MKTLFIATAMVAAGSFLFAQDDLEPAGPLSPISPAHAVAGLSKSSGLSTGAIGTLNPPTLQIWQYQMLATRNGGTYTGSIVGTNPFNRGARTATIPVVVIPLRVQFTGTVRNFDATSADDGCLGAGNTALSLALASDIFQQANHTINGVNMGNTTFIDAFQRAEFWSQVSNVSPAYHLAFSVSTAAKQTITVANGTTNGTTYVASNSCSSNALASDNPANRFGVVNINFIDPLLQGFITTLGITPNQFPLFVLYGVVISDGSALTTSNCCILGYHNGSGVASAPGQTYGIAEYDQSYIFTGVKNTSVMSHEVLEWANDPSVNNLVPAWGGIGQVSGCQTNLETGDPLSGILMPGVSMPNGVTYFSQENAFFGWFFGSPAGAGNKYSSNGTFGGVAKVCPPGGTN